MISAKSEIRLDIGAGTGKLSIPLIMQSKKVLSADSSVQMLKIARLKSHELSIDLTTVISDVHFLCFKDHTFDGEYYFVSNPGTIFYPNDFYHPIGNL